ncbi:MAG: fmt [Steroidobacteraceae bacterium]|nr:fmt [Steroidobacteraceae bacterium]
MPLRIVFAGTPEFAVPALEALHAAGHSIVAVYTQPDRPAGRGRELVAGPIKRRAGELGLAVEQPATLKTRGSQARLAEYAPDVMVVVAYGLILPQAVLDVPRLGCLNIHASLLPRWRGAAPIQRAVLAGDTRTGISIMQMDAGLDTGPELLRRELAIGPRETSGELHDRLAPLGAGAIVEALARLANGTLRPRAQPDEGVTYAAKIRKDEARIDWTRSAVGIDRLVRAFNPSPVAETRLDGEQVRIWDAQPFEHRGQSDFREKFGVSPVPGTVLDAPGRIVVATGDGALELLTLQLPGRKPVSARDALNARDLRGLRFDSAVSA